MPRRPFLLLPALALAMGLMAPAAQAGGPRYCFPHGPHGKIKCKKLKVQTFKAPKYEKHKWKEHKHKWKD
jgi:hypothetical protein